LALNSLTEAQKEVLKTIALSKERLFASELGRILDKSQVAVFKNLQPLLDIQPPILTTELEYRGGKRIIKLTAKGGWWAIRLLGEYEAVISNHPYLFNSASIKMLSDWSKKKLFGTDIRIDRVFMKHWADIVINNNLFDAEGDEFLNDNKYKGPTAKRYEHYKQMIALNTIYEIVDQVKAKVLTENDVKEVINFFRSLYPNVSVDYETISTMVNLNS
jgi:hypothetical protein